MTFKELVKSVTKKEWRLVLGLAIFLMVITGIHYLYAYFTTPPDAHYLGIHSLAPGDTHLYYSYIEQVRQGHWLFKDLYTAEPQQRTLFNLFFLGLGLLGRLTGFSNILTLQIARLLLIPFLVVVLYLFAAYLFRDLTKRKISLYLLLFGSGLGAWLIPFFDKLSYSKPGYYHWPMDLWTPEFNIFLIIYHNPLYIASLGLIVLSFLFLLLGFDNNSLKYTAGAGFFGLILFQIHPYHVPTIYSVWCVFLLVNFISNKKIDWLKIKDFLIFILISSPSVIYYLLMIKYDWVINQRINNQGGYTTVFWLTAVSYGFILLAAAAGLLAAARNKFKENHYLFLAVWAVVGFILIYLPQLKHPRRLTEGLQIPLVFLGVYGLFFLYNFFKKRLSNEFNSLFLDNKFFILLIFILFFCFSNIFNVARDLFYAQQRLPLFYISNEKLQAFYWLRDNAIEDQGILASGLISNLIPGIIGRTVYCGHSSETADFDKKHQLVSNFFGGRMAEEEAYEFLKNGHVRHIYYSDLERDLGSFQPESKPYLKKVFENRGAIIYEVVRFD